MSSRALAGLGVAIVAAAAVLFVDVIWDEFVTPSPSLECTDASAPGGFQACGIAHYFHDPSIGELVVRWGIALALLGGVAALATRVVARARILAGSLASAMAATIAYAMLFAHALKLGPISLGNAAFPFLCVLGAAISYGAIASWLTLRWWPDSRADARGQRHPL